MSRLWPTAETACRVRASRGRRSPPMPRAGRPAAMAPEVTATTWWPAARSPARPAHERARWRDSSICPSSSVIDDVPILATTITSRHRRRGSSRCRRRPRSPTRRRGGTRTRGDRCARSRRPWRRPWRAPGRRRGCGAAPGRTRAPRALVRSDRATARSAARPTHPPGAVVVALDRDALGGTGRWTTNAVGSGSAARAARTASAMAPTSRATPSPVTAEKRSVGHRRRHAVVGRQVGAASRRRPAGRSSSSGW